VGNLGGDISATSELDKGTTFRVVLPRQPKSHFAMAA
jgi:signal transduction histidine kinase